MNESIDREWQDGDDSALYEQGYEDGFDAGYLRALSHVMGFVAGYDGGTLTKNNILSVAMQLRKKQKGEQ